MTEIRSAMNECNSVLELAKKVTIYDAIVNVKDGWGNFHLQPSRNVSSLVGFSTACLTTVAFLLKTKLKIKERLMNLIVGSKTYRRCHGRSIWHSMRPNANTCTDTSSEDQEQDDEILSNERYYRYCKLCLH